MKERTLSSDLAGTIFSNDSKKEISKISISPSPLYRYSPWGSLMDTNSQNSLKKAFDHTRRIGIMESITPDGISVPPGYFFTVSHVEPLSR